jgi:FlgD Ig-like domain
LKVLVGRNVTPKEKITMGYRTLARAVCARGIVVRSLWIALLAGSFVSSTATASVISTTDAGTIATFQSGRTVLNFDELTVPAGPCYIPFVSNTYAAQGILISAGADGSFQTNLARLPGCGDFGPTLTPPNIIGGGTGPGSTGWRDTVRFDFPTPVDAIGASSDWTGSHTTLTAYKSDGTVIESVSGDQGNFMGIEDPDISYAVWNWDYDEAVVGFSLDNVTFTALPTGVRSPAITPSLVITPNPFDTETMIGWSLSAPARVRISVYDVRGRLVATVLDEPRPAGEGVIGWNARDDHGRAVVSGIYFVRLDVPGGMLTRRIVRLR